MYSQVFAGIEAVQGILQEVLHTIVRGEKPVVIVAEGKDCIDFNHYLRQYQVRMQENQLAAQKAAEEADKKKAEAAAIPEGATVFGGENG